MVFFFHLDFKEDDVLHREKHSERKDKTSVFSLPLSSSLADSHLQGSLLQSRWQQWHFPSIQRCSYCMSTLCQALPGELVLNPGSWGESAPQVSNTLHFPRKSACFTGFLTKAPYGSLSPITLSSSFSTTRDTIEGRYK